MTRRASVASESVAPGSVARDSVAPESVAPESVAPESVAPESLAPESVAPERAAARRGETRTPDRLRRRIVVALGLGSTLATRASAQVQGPAVVEGGTPQRIPLTAVADLAIELDGSDAEGPIDLAVLTLGSIDVPSGRLAGMDALLLDGAPYDRPIEPGRYPLQLVLARLPGGEERVAFVQVKLANRDADRWTPATIEGDSADELADDDLPGFDVESGVACLFDAGALAAWRTALAGDTSMLPALERVLRENRRPVWTWARVRAAGGSGLLFTAGMGEGFYSAYWGIDRTGQTVSLVLDFDLLDWAGLPAAEPVTT